MKPVILDTFCKAGGAGWGYHLAGFEVVGVDIQSQPNYPFEFHQADAIEFIKEHGHKFDVIHASPPCQAYSVSRTLTTGIHPELIIETRNALKKVGKPYIIENVPGSPLINPVLLCGTMFGLKVIRHRLFENSLGIQFSPNSCNHWSKIGKNGFCTMFGTGSSKDKGGNKSMWQSASGITWMTVAEMAQAIPPAYTHWLGSQVLACLTPRQLRQGATSDKAGLSLPAHQSV